MPVPQETKCIIHLHGFQMQTRRPSLFLTQKIFSMISSMILFPIVSYQGSSKAGSIGSSMDR